MNDDVEDIMRQQQPHHITQSILQQAKRGRGNIFNNQTSSKVDIQVDFSAEGKDYGALSMRDTYPLGQQNYQSNYELKRAQIDLSESGASGSLNKRPNLFDEKSRSRERILTKSALMQQTLMAHQEKQEQFSNFERIKVSPKNPPQPTVGDNEILKDFPFLGIQSSYQKKANALGDAKLKAEEMLYSSNMRPRTTAMQESPPKHSKYYYNNRDLSPQNTQQTSQAIPNQMFASLYEESKDEYRVKKYIPADFLQGVDQMSQSEVSQSTKFNKQSLPSVGRISGRPREEYEITQKELNEINMHSSLKDQEINSKSSQLLRGQASSKAGTKTSIDFKKHMLKNEGGIVKVMALNVDAISNQFIDQSNSDEDFKDALDDDGVESDFKATKQSDKLQIQELHLSGIEVDVSREGFEGTGSTNEQFLELHAFNRKEERTKTQILQHVLSKIMYETVIPNEIEALSSEVYQQLSLKTRDPQKSRQQYENYINDAMIPKVLVSFIQEFMNVTNGQVDSEKALKQYMDEVMIEEVNFTLCSEIWNACLLLPQIAKEDPSLCVSNLLTTFVKEIAEEALDDFRKQPVPDPRKSVDVEKLVSYEIMKYLDENLINDVIFDQVEEEAFAILQEVYQSQAKMSGVISSEIYNDMIRRQLRPFLQTLLKKEKTLNMQADKFLEAFLGEETREIAYGQLETPESIAESLVDKALSLVAKQTVSEAAKAAEQVSGAIRLVCDNLVEMQVCKLINSLASYSISSNKKDQSLLSKCSDSLTQEVMFSMLTNIILSSIEYEKNLHKVADKISDKIILFQFPEIIDECVTEELLVEEIDGMVDKIVEFDIWRESVREFQVEEAAMDELLDDLVNQATKEFFFENFIDIKDEYLRNFKEQIMKQELYESQQQLNRSQQMLSDSFYSARSKSKYETSLLMSTSKQQLRIGQTASKRTEERGRLNQTEKDKSSASQFYSAKSECFYECNDEDVIDREFQRLQQEQQQQHYFAQELQQRELNKSGLAPSFQANEVSMHQISSNPRNDGGFLFEETIDMGDLDEGMTTVNTLYNDYVIPKIKSLDFLNIEQKEFFKKFQGLLLEQMNPQKKVVKKEDTMLPIDSQAVDVLCVNCYECIKFDMVDDHSLRCIPQTSTMKQSFAKSTPTKKYKPDPNLYQQYFAQDDFNHLQPEALMMLDQDEYEGLMMGRELSGERMHTKGFNFEEGRYVMQQSHQQQTPTHPEDKELQAQEEREYIAELNERIFKLHKAIKEKQIEEQSRINKGLQGGSDLTFIRHLDDIEQLSIGIFTNNANKKELELLENELLEKIKELKPLNSKELSLTITAKRLSQLALEKIQSVLKYQNLVENRMGYSPNYGDFSHIEDDQLDDNYQSHREFEDEPFKFPRSFSAKNFQERQIEGMDQADFDPNAIHLQKVPTFDEDQLLKIEEESKQQKAELEVWRNIHNEILKNYLISKAQVKGKHLNEINSDISNSRQDLMSENGSSYSSLAGSSFNMTPFQSTSALASPQQVASKSSGLEVNDIGQLSEVDESLRLKESEDQKRYFYTIAIHCAKKTLKIIPQGSILQQLHKKCLEQKIPVQDWERFVNQEMPKIKSQMSKGL